jgi:hypothetical protein
VLNSIHLIVKVKKKQVYNRPVCKGVQKASKGKIVLQILKYLVHVCKHSAKFQISELKIVERVDFTK